MIILLNQLLSPKTKYKFWRSAFISPNSNELGTEKGKHQSMLPSHINYVSIHRYSVETATGNILSLSALNIAYFLQFFICKMQSCLRKSSVIPILPSPCYNLFSQLSTPCQLDESAPAPYVLQYSADCGFLSDSSRLVHDGGFGQRRRDEPCCPAESHHETGRCHLHAPLLLQPLWRGYVWQMHMYVRSHSNMFSRLSSSYVSHLLYLHMQSCILCPVSDTEELSVSLMEGPRSTTLWWLTGSHGNQWQRGEVTVGRIPQDFTILFQASRTFNKPGHIAIDDIHFTNCTLPGKLTTFLYLFTASTFLCRFHIDWMLFFFVEPQPGCPESKFLCNNSVCVDNNQVCDFSDDCGDRSDESNCGEISSWQWMVDCATLTENSVLVHYSIYSTFGYDSVCTVLCVHWGVFLRTSL